MGKQNKNIKQNVWQKVIKMGIYDTQTTLQLILDKGSLTSASKDIANGFNTAFAGMAENFNKAKITGQGPGLYDYRGPGAQMAATAGKLVGGVQGVVGGAVEKTTKGEGMGVMAGAAIGTAFGTMIGWMTKDNDVLNNIMKIFRLIFTLFIMPFVILLMPILGPLIKEMAKHMKAFAEAMKTGDFGKAAIELGIVMAGTLPILLGAIVAKKAVELGINLVTNAMKGAVGALFDLAGKAITQTLPAVMNIASGTIDSVITWVRSNPTASMIVSIGVAYAILEATTKGLSWVFGLLADAMGRDTELGKTFTKLEVRLEEGYLAAIWKTITDDFAKLPAAVIKLTLAPDTDIQKLVGNAIKGIPGIGTLFQLPSATEEGAGLIDTIIGGITGKKSELKQSMVNVFNSLINLMPHSDAKEGPLSKLTFWGKSIMTTIAIGITNNIKFLTDAMTSAMNAMKVIVDTTLAAIQTSVNATLKSIADAQQAANNLPKNIGGTTTPTPTKTTTPTTKVKDFILTKEGSLVQFSPDDNILGMRDLSKIGLGGKGVNLTYSPTYNISAATDRNDLKRIFDEHDTKLKRDLQSQLSYVTNLRG